jgi:hypothetical protein
MSIRIYGVLILIAGVLTLWFASPPLSFSGELLFMYIGGFSAICTGFGLMVRGEYLLRLFDLNPPQ